MPKKIDLTGKVIGKWTVISKAENIGKRTAWNCKCECGSEKVVATESLTKMQSKSCGCSRYDHFKSKTVYEDLSGLKFGRLTVLNFHDKKSNRVRWLCKCECGKVKPVYAKLLKSGNAVSCGCFQKEIASKNSKTHGKSKTRIYYIWQNIKDRCHNPNSKNYKNYGGRGIKLYNDWNIFEEFEKWAMSNGYEENLTIERINVNGNYEPLNCTWIPLSLQSMNKRSTVNIEFNGETKTLSEWARYFKVSHSTIQYHVKMGTIEKNFSKLEMQKHR